MTKPVLEQARDIIEVTLLAVPPFAFSMQSPAMSAYEAYQAWCRDRANNAAQALMELLCDPNDSRASIVSGDITSRYYFEDRPAPTDDDERIK